MPYRAAPIKLDETTRAELERRVRAMTTPQRDVTRARIVLLAAEGSFELARLASLVTSGNARRVFPGLAPG